jgi:hypothetical protein
MEACNTTSVVKQVHLLPSLVEVNSDEPSCDEIEDLENLADYFE